MPLHFARHRPEKTRTLGRERRGFPFWLGGRQAVARHAARPTAARPGYSNCSKITSFGIWGHASGCPVPVGYPSATCPSRNGTATPQHCTPEPRRKSTGGRRRSGNSQLWYGIRPSPGRARTKRREPGGGFAGRWQNRGGHCRTSFDLLHDQCVPVGRSPRVLALRAKIVERPSSAAAGATELQPR